MKKYCKILVVMVALLAAQPACCRVGSGFSKIWDGTKDIVSGTWNTVSSPFRSKKDGGKTKKDKKTAEVKPAKTIKSSKSGCVECDVRARKQNKNKRKK